ncbi:MAG TPA: hypothetical protein VHG72_20135 [Polyangia bacterium]|nr:hypothetical protein [Polyangia bacterium]
MIDLEDGEAERTTSAQEKRRRRREEEELREIERGSGLSFPASAVAAQVAGGSGSVAGRSCVFRKLNVWSWWQVSLASSVEVSRKPGALGQPFESRSSEGHLRHTRRRCSSCAVPT